jgi:hypothetical protein
MVLVFGIALGAAGIFLGSQPISQGGYDCGSAFSSNVRQLESSAAFAQLGSAYSGSGWGDLGLSSQARKCQNEIDNTKPLAIGLVAVGAAAALAGAVGAAGSRTRESPTGSAGPETPTRPWHR